MMSGGGKEKQVFYPNNVPQVEVENKTHYDIMIVPY